MRPCSATRTLWIVLSVSVLATVPAHMTAAQEAPAAGLPANTIVVRYDVPLEALSGVSSTAELIAALRDHLTMEASTPLETALTIHLSGRFGQNPDNRYDFGSGIILQIEPHQPVSGSIASLPLATYSDWDSDEAWQYFQEETEVGLLNSLLASGGFTRDEHGRVPLTVAAVHADYADLEDQGPLGDRMLLELWPERRYETESRFGSPTPPEGYAEDVGVVIIELAPATTVTGGAAASDPPEGSGRSETAGAAGTVTVSQEALGRLAGEYGEGGQTIVIRSDGESLLFSHPDEPGSEEWRLHPLSEKDFWADYHGQRVELSFSRDEDGRAFAVTMSQAGVAMKVARLR